MNELHTSRAALCAPACSCGTEAGSYLRLIDSCVTQLKAQGPSRTCNESKEEEEEAYSCIRAWGFGLWVQGLGLRVSGSVFERSTRRRSLLISLSLSLSLALSLSHSAM